MYVLMAKLQDRPTLEETRKAGSFLDVKPFISASYRGALNFYAERKGWTKEDIWNAIRTDVGRIESRPEKPTPVEMVAEYVNDRLIYQLQHRYGFEVDKVLEGMREIVQKEEP
jgi:hypothetical protein